VGNELPVRNGMKLQGQNYWFLDNLQVNFILIGIIPYIIITVSHINQQMSVTVLQILYQFKKSYMFGEFQMQRKTNTST
jgi:hypothetical protein